MLLQFSVANFRSFKEEITLNLAPAKSRTLKDHILKSHTKRKVEALPLGLVYGANASGKTNLIKAMLTLQGVITKPLRRDDLIPVQSYSFDEEWSTKPSKFEVVFTAGEIVYTYGIVVSKTRVEEEWLFAYYSSQESRLFERVTDSEGKLHFEGGSKLEQAAGGKRYLDHVVRGTNPNQPFLQEAYERGVSILEPVWNWFKEGIQVVLPQWQYVPLMLRAQQDQDFRDWLSTVLRQMKTGVERVEFVTLSWSKEQVERFLQTLPVQIQLDLQRDLKKKGTIRMIETPDLEWVVLKSRSDGSVELDLTVERLVAVHKDSLGNEKEIPMREESDGTRRLMHLAPLLQRAGNEGRTIFIDELDRSLHPHLTNAFIDLCIQQAISRDNAHQYIITTHDPHLLDTDFLRKDEIWFTQKRDEGWTELYSMSEYPKIDGLNLQRGYLQGRFGAVPHVSHATLEREVL